MKARHRVFYLVAYLWYFFRDKRQAGLYRHLFLDAYKNHLQNHPLGADSIVFVVGGYKGKFAADLASKFNPRLYVFEPVERYCSEIVARFKDNPKVKVFNVGLSNRTHIANFFVNETSSSIYEPSDTTEQVSMVDVCQFVAENNIERIDLMSVNTEGSEYDILPRLLDSGFINQIETIQIQFHLFDSPKYVQARSDIVKRILETHRIKYSFPFTWECFSKKESNQGLKAKSLIRAVYRILPFKRPVILAMRFLGLGRLLPAVLKDYLVFEGAFAVPVEEREFLMCNGYGRQIEAAVFWDGLEAFEGSTLRWWQKLAKNSQVILDVGANTGIYSLLAKTLQPSAEVHAFEPIARIHRILTANFSLNNLPPRAAHRVALSDYTGDGQMFDLPVEHMYTASLNKDIHAERGNDLPARRESVPVKRLDDFLTAEKCQRVDLIKIDVESHEAAVIRGMGDWLRRFHPSLIVEIWNNEVGEDVEAALRECSYRYFALVDSVPEPRAHIRNDFPDRGYLNYLICTENVGREIGLFGNAGNAT